MTPDIQSAADRIVAAAKRIALAEPARPIAHDLDEEIATGRFPEPIERLRTPLQKFALHEGLLVQNLATLALSRRPGLLVEAKFRAEVTDADRKFLSRNEHIDLDVVAPPAPGEPVAKVEVDIVVYDPRLRKLVLVDVKRSPRPGESILAMREASLDVRRRVQVRHPILTTEIYLLRWFVGDGNALEPYVLTRGTIDDRLGNSVSPVVDYGLRAFRVAFGKHFGALLGDPNAATAHAPMQPDPEGDVVAFRRLFGRGARRGRRA